MHRIAKNRSELSLVISELKISKSWHKYLNTTNASEEMRLSRHECFSIENIYILKKCIETLPAHT